MKTHICDYCKREIPIKAMRLSYWNTVICAECSSGGELTNEQMIEARNFNWTEFAAHPVKELA